METVSALDVEATNPALPESTAVIKLVPGGIRDAVSPTPVRDRRQPGPGSTRTAISGGVLSTAAEQPLALSAREGGSDHRPSGWQHPRDGISSVFAGSRVSAIQPGLIRRATGPGEERIPIRRMTERIQSCKTTLSNDL